MEPCAEISKIDYKLGQDNVQFLGLDAHNPVFVVSSLTIVAFVAGVLAFQTAAAAAFVALRVWLMSTFDWVFMGTGNLSVLFCLLLVVTPYGAKKRPRLGRCWSSLLRNSWVQKFACFEVNEAQAESLCAVTEVAERPGAMLGLIGLDSRIGVVDVTS